MSIKITWKPDGETPTSWTISDEALTALDSYRKTIMDVSQVQMPDGTFSNNFAPRYPDVKAMIVGEFVRFLVTPAFQQFPPAAVAKAQADVDTAQKALKKAHDEAAASLLS